MVVRNSQSLFSGADRGTTQGLSVEVMAGYNSRAHNMTLSYNRAPTDTTGFGSRGSQTIAGSWSWNLPSRVWSVTANGARQQLAGGAAGDIQYWQADVNIGRAVSRQFMLVFSVGYIGRPAVVSSIVGGSQDLSGTSGRMSFVWTPHRNERLGAGGWGCRRLGDEQCPARGLLHDSVVPSVHLGEGLVPDDLGRVPGGSVSGGGRQTAGSGEIPVDSADTRHFRILPSRRR